MDAILVILAALILGFIVGYLVGNPNRMDILFNTEILEEEKSYYVVKIDNGSTQQTVYVYNKNQDGEFVEVLEKRL